MAIKFDFYQTPGITGKEKKIQYHARIVHSETIGTDELAQEIHQDSTLTKGDVKAALSALSDVLIRKLCEGKRIHLEGVGYFQMTLDCTQTNDPQSAHAQRIRFKSVKFRADKSLKKELSQRASFERIDRKSHSQSLSHAEIDARLKRFFSEKKVITRADIEQLCGFTRSMALRHINRLKEENKLENINTNRMPIYIPIGDYLKER